MKGMWRRGWMITAAVACAASAAHAQFVNGDFGTGRLEPWIVEPTAFGASLVTSVGSLDLDGSGPMPAGPALRLLVGQTTLNTGWQGVYVHQLVPLIEGRRYRVQADWSALGFVNAHRQSAGRFEIVADGEVVDANDAPVLSPAMSAYGRVSGVFFARQTATRAVGVRVTRQVPRGEEVFQDLDNLVLVPFCPADFDDGSTFGIPDGGVTIDDLLYYLGLFSTGDVRADLDDGSGTGTPDGGVTIDDLLYVLVRFEGGC